MLIKEQLFAWKKIDTNNSKKVKVDFVGNPFQSFWELEEVTFLHGEKHRPTIKKELKTNKQTNKQTNKKHKNKTWKTVLLNYTIGKTQTEVYRARCSPGEKLFLHIICLSFLICCSFGRSYYSIALKRPRIRYTNSLRRFWYNLALILIRN